MALFSSKSAHPLADGKELRRVLDALAGMDAVAALEETKAWLESLAHAEDLKTEQCLELVLRLDEATLAHARRLGRDYLTAPRLSRSEEYRLWNCNYSYWTQLVAAYEYCLDRHPPGDKRLKSLEPLLPLLYVRMILAYAAGIKWAQFRYGPAEVRFWLGAGRVYLAALAAKIERKPLLVYPNGKESTVEQEYLQTLMLHSSSVNKLLPLEVEIAERLVAYLVPQLVFTSEVNAANVYWIDASKPLPPTRLARIPEMTPTLRFLRPGAALDKLAAIRDVIVRSGKVPVDLQLGGQYTPAIVLPVLDHLALNWQPKPPMRSHQRHQVKSRLSVIHGFATIHDRLANGKSFFADGSEEEAWIVDDVSVGGMGAQVPLGVNEWIRIGALIGIQPAGGDNWLVGMIRRFNRGDGRGAVGIQTIGKSPQAVVADSGGLNTELVLLDLPPLPQSQPDAGIDALLVESITVDGVLASSAYESNIVMRVFVEGRMLNLKPHSLIERGVDFAIVRFHVEIVS